MISERIQDSAIRWGVVGTGHIARKFVADLEHVPDAEVVAVASRFGASARDFADEFGVERCYEGYDALAADPGIDVVYVSTLAPFHHRDTLAQLKAGHPVLCEKPFAINAGEVDEMIAEARARGLFLMEAAWSRFLPSWALLRSLIEHGAIGEVRVVDAEFGFVADRDLSARLFDPEKGGGALIDLGVYPCTLASMCLGQPATVSATGHLGPDGVDEQSAIMLGYPGGSFATLKAAIATEMSNTARIMGSEGSVTLPAFFHHADALTLQSSDGRREMACPHIGNGLHYQVEEVHRCLREGRTESSVMPLDESRAVIASLDAARAQIGLVYPSER